MVCSVAPGRLFGHDTAKRMIHGTQTPLFLEGVSKKEPLIGDRPQV